SWSPFRGGGFSRPAGRMLVSDWSPLHDAAFNGRVLALQGLIGQGTCVNLSTLDRVSPLHGACARGHLACADLLIQNGANRGANPSGSDHTNSPIHRAAAKGHPECMDPLVRHGADVDQVIEQQGSPLHVACSNQHLSTVRKLLELGACVNSSVRGESPLHIAARLSSPELASVLLDHGAAPSPRNWEGKRPLDLAPPDSPVERLLRQGGSEPPAPQPGLRL
uniref:Uncharacterized protein n=1 Tax=Takifugu rubripes TaxID=31033 RepID=A0A3B5KDB0_TAKRU